MAKVKKRKRPPSPGPKYTEQIVLLISKDARAVVDVATREQGLSQAAVCRTFLYLGMKAAGYRDLVTTDEPGHVGAAVQVAKELEEAATSS